MTAKRDISPAKADIENTSFDEGKTEERREKGV